jgi:stalled ribosome alternative rescue factor ArfA
MSKHNVYAKELSNPQYKQRIIGAKKGKASYSRKDRKYRKIVDYD